MSVQSSSHPSHRAGARRGLRHAIVLTALAVAGVAFAHEPATHASHLLYLPSQAPGTDNAAITRSLDELGYRVTTLSADGQDRVAYARRVADEIDALIANGVQPVDIGVVGVGSGSPVAALASAAAGRRDVSYVLLGGCDVVLKSEHRFRMSGRVLGVRDDADPASHSCRALWQNSPKVSERLDLVLNTGHGAALFDAPRREWLQPVADWTSHGRVDVGEIELTRVDRD